MVVGMLGRECGTGLLPARLVVVCMPVVVRLLSHRNFGLRSRACDWAHHGSSQRAPKREQHCKQHQEPNAKRLHRS